MVVVVAAWATAPQPTIPTVVDVVLLFEALPLVALPPVVLPETFA